MDSRDLCLTLVSENEIDNAIYAVLCAAFEAALAEEAPVRRAVRHHLGARPTPQQIIDEVCAELRRRGRLFHEEQRRLQAAHVMAAFLDLPASEREDVSLMAAG